MHVELNHPLNYYLKSEEKYKNFPSLFKFS